MTLAMLAFSRPRLCLTPIPTPRLARLWQPSKNFSVRCDAMLRHLLIHPQINGILGRAGHHARILIADGNYPASSKKGPNAEQVCLNLMPGVVTSAQALEAV